MAPDHASPGLDGRTLQARKARFYDPQPFVWTYDADQILAKVNRLNASVHFCNGALGVKSLTVVSVTGVSLLSVVGLDAAT